MPVWWVLNVNRITGMDGQNKGPSVPPRHTLADRARLSPLLHWLATSYLCGELYLFVGWFAECLFAEVRFSLQS